MSVPHEGGGRSPAIEGVNEGLEACTDRTPSDRRVTTGGRMGGWEDGDRPTTRDLARRKGVVRARMRMNENEYESRGAQSSS